MIDVARHLVEQHLLIGGEAGAHGESHHAIDQRAAGAALHRVTRVETAVPGEVGIERQAHQAALAARGHRQRRDRLRVQPPVAHDADQAEPLGEIDGAVGSEGDRPRHLQATDHRLHPRLRDRRSARQERERDEESGDDAQPGAHSSRVYRGP